MTARWSRGAGSFGWDGDAIADEDRAASPSPVRSPLLSSPASALQPGLPGRQWGGGDTSTVHPRSVRKLPVSREVCYPQCFCTSTTSGGASPPPAPPPQSSESFYHARVLHLVKRCFCGRDRAVVGFRALPGLAALTDLRTPGQACGPGTNPRSRACRFVDTVVSDVLLLCRGRWRPRSDAGHSAEPRARQLGPLCPLSPPPPSRHPRATAAFALLPQRGGSSTSLCFPPGHTQPSAARPASRSPRRPPLPGASRLPRSLQPLPSLGSPRWHVTSSRKPPNAPRRGPLALPAAARLCSPQMPLLRACLDAVPVHAGNQGRASGSARRRPAHFLPTAGPWRPPRRTERPARGAGGRQRGAAHGPRAGTRAAKGQRTVPEAGGRRRAPGTAAGPPRPPPAPASSRRARGGRCSRRAGGVFCSLFSFFTDGAS